MRRQLPHRDVEVIKNVPFVQPSQPIRIQLPFRETSSSTSCMKLAISGGILWISLSLSPSFRNFTSWKKGCRVTRTTKLIERKKMHAGTRPGSLLGGFYPQQVYGFWKEVQSGEKTDILLLVHVFMVNCHINILVFWATHPTHICWLPVSLCLTTHRSYLGGPNPVLTSAGVYLAWSFRGHGVKRCVAQASTGQMHREKRKLRRDEERRKMHAGSGGI